jgi:hypothetical protein
LLVGGSTDRGNVVTAFEGALTLISGLVIGLLIGRFLPSYFSEKGKNLATREDIAKITEAIEKVRTTYQSELQQLQHQNNVVIEELRGRHQLRMAAVERRLEAHQEAFTLWRRLMSEKDGPKGDGLIEQCQDWWERNCLYLNQEAREQFQAAYFAVAIHRRLMERGEVDIEKINKNLRRLFNAGDAIVRGAQLPSLGEREKLDVRKHAEQEADSADR